MILLPKKIGGEPPLFFSYKSNYFLNYKSFKNVEYFISGRNAILEIIKKERISQVFLPSYYCYPIYLLIKESKGIKVINYKNKEDLINKINKTNSSYKKLIIFVLFNGMFESLDDFKNIKESIKYDYISLLDAAMTPHLENYGSYDYIVTNPRKFYRSALGAIVYIEKKRCFNFEYIVNPFFTFNYLLSKYLSRLLLSSRIFLLENLGIKINQYSELNVPVKMDLLSLFFLKYMNFKYLRNERVKQFNLYYKYLEPLKELFYFKNKPSLNDCPFGFIIQSEKRDEIQIHLIKNRIYTSSLWQIPNKLKTEIGNEIVAKSNKILVLPIGPQYSYFEIKRVCQIILDFFKK